MVTSQNYGCSEHLNLERHSAPQDPGEKDKGVVCGAAGIWNNGQASLSNLLQRCPVQCLTSSVTLNILGEVLFKGEKKNNQPTRSLSVLRQVPKGKGPEAGSLKSQPKAELGFQFPEKLSLEARGTVRRAIFKPMS